MAEKEQAVFRIIIKASMEAVWRELTKSNVVLPFFFGSVLDTDGLAPGNRICMRTAAGKYTGVVGKGLEFDPPHHYAHTFRFTQLEDAPCTVTYGHCHVWTPPVLQGRN